jgi:hypothetical protein
MSLSAYQAYGLSICTELLCPELSPYPHLIHDPDVTITLLSEEEATLSPLPDHRYDVRPGRFQLEVPEVARYRVEDGQRIFIQIIGNAPPDKVRLFLFGSTMGALLYQRGLLPLHGSAVVTRLGVMIFVGPQGSGKSTLAAEFHRRGYHVMSDDVCAVDNTPHGLRVLPALTQFRLRNDAYQRLGASREAYFEVDKFAVPMGEKYCPHPKPLRAIHILCDDSAEHPGFEGVRGLDRVRRLFENLYRPHFLKGQRTQSELVRLVGVIAEHTTITLVKRNRNTTAAADLASFLEVTWAERSGTSFGPGEESNAQLCS